MPCYKPLQGWYSVDGETQGKVVFNRLPGSLYIETPLPCGKCLGCRMENARNWAIRCMHEAELHEDNCMVTLTYDEEHIPKGGGLKPDDVSLWMKRLRKNFPERKIKFFLAGEYGEQLKRPHYHVLLFDIDFRPEFVYNETDTRPSLDELRATWPYGHVHVAPLTFETASYVARYCLKKQETENDYLNKETGEILQKEFTRMSRRPGIANKWIQTNLSDTYKDDTVMLSGRKSRPPRYYDKVVIKTSGENALEKIKRKRIEESFARRENNTPARLAVKEKIATAKKNLLKRSYENA